MVKETVAFVTLGCKVNQSETQGIRDSFAAAGYHVVPAREKADIYVINTCSVTAMSESKSRQLISRVHKQNPEACVVVTGCYAQRNAETLLGLPGVSLVVGTNRKSEIPQLAKAFLQSHARQSLCSPAAAHTVYEELPIHSHDGRTRAYMKIEDGCDNFCSYCIIPYLRGPVRSRAFEAVIAEAIRLSENGFCELVLGGIHLSSYGRDLNNKSLADVLEAMQALSKVKRIRLGSLEPRLITPAFIDRIRPLTKLCPHFHLSLQSGCDTVLGRMNRKYTTAQYAQGCAMLRSAFPGCAISTDIIVGFPGETEAEFAQTLAFVQRIGFSSVHVFAYSVREGTQAAEMPGQIPPGTKKDREHRLMQLVQAQTHEYLSSFIGLKVQVLCEKCKDGTTSGLTKEHAPVSFKGTRASGELVTVCIQTLNNGILGGTLL